jgi:hypothetical protein
MVIPRSVRDQIHPADSCNETVTQSGENVESAPLEVVAVLALEVTSPQGQVGDEEGVAVDVSKVNADGGIR